MPDRIVILGGGTGGTIAANRLRRSLPEGRADIVVVDRDDAHVYQPGLLFVPFGMAAPSRLVRSRARQLLRGVELVRHAVDAVDLGAGTVALDDGSTLGYDVLVVATGAALLFEETEGLTGPGWRRTVHTFYDMEGAAALAGALARFDAGHLVVDVVDMPIKCPVAPLEFLFLADWWLQRRGVRDRVRLTFATPLDGAFTKAVCNPGLRGSRVVIARGW